MLPPLKELILIVGLVGALRALQELTGLPLLDKARQLAIKAVNTAATSLGSPADAFGLKSKQPNKRG